VYLYDRGLGIKVFADKAFYAFSDKEGKQAEATPFLLKKDAQAHATKTGGRLLTYNEVLGTTTTTASR
jgi:NitT/TauT family transport system substrate-binding protein